MKNAFVEDFLSGKTDNLSKDELVVKYQVDLEDITDEDKEVMLELKKVRRQLNEVQNCLLTVKYGEKLADGELKISYKNLKNNKVHKLIGDNFKEAVRGEQDRLYDKLMYLEEELTINNLYKEIGGGFCEYIKEKIDNSKIPQIELNNLKLCAQSYFDFVVYNKPFAENELFFDNKFWNVFFSNYTYRKVFFYHFEYLKLENHKKRLEEVGIFSEYK